MGQILSIIEMSVLTKSIYRFNTIPVKISSLFLVEIETLILKVIWKSKKAKGLE